MAFSEQTAVHLAPRLLSGRAAGASVDGDSRRAAAASRKLAPAWKEDAEAAKWPCGLQCGAASCGAFRRCGPGCCRCTEPRRPPVAAAGMCTPAWRYAVCMIDSAALL